MFIPDPKFFHPGSRIRIKEIMYFNPIKWFLSSRQYFSGCSSRIQIFCPTPTQGSKRHRIPDPHHCHCHWLRPPYLQSEPTKGQYKAFSVRYWKRRNQTINRSGGRIGSRRRIPYWKCDRSTAFCLWKGYLTVSTMDGPCLPGPIMGSLSMMDFSFLF